MKTRPTVPGDEVALDQETINRFLASLGPDMILVGGQALAFWMDRYGLRDPDDLVTADGDALGNKAAARALARRLNARFKAPADSALTSLVGQVRIRNDDGRVGNIDVLDKLYQFGGLHKSTDFTKRVIERSVPAVHPEGFTFRVMDPFDLLDSRIQNAAGLLEDKGPHVLTQARWAIEVAREGLLRHARAEAKEDTTVERVGAIIKGIVGLAKSAAGRRVFAEHGIDVLAAIDIERLRRLLPAHGPQLDQVAEERAQRSSARPPAAAMPTRRMKR